MKAVISICLMTLLILTVPDSASQSIDCYVCSDYISEVTCSRDLKLIKTAQCSIGECFKKSTTESNIKKPLVERGCGNSESQGLKGCFTNDFGSEICGCDKFLCNSSTLPYPTVFVISTVTALVTMLKIC